MRSTHASEPADDAVPEEKADDPRVLSALKEYQALLDEGKQPARQAFLANYPDISDPLAEALEALEFMRAAMPPNKQHALPPMLGAGAMLGDYRIIREIGRGGMGVVFEAEQQSLNRRVALKILPHQSLEPRQLERFRREAQAAARLHHTNIVPVFGVGVEQGIHFYAMQFISGWGLDRTIRQLKDASTGKRAHKTKTRSSMVAGAEESTQRHISSAVEPTAGHTKQYVDDPADMGLNPFIEKYLADHLRWVARLGIQAAEGLEHAHRQGVLHRDIKPSNLLLDEQGAVWITDFGLARLEGAEQLTGSGEVAGTLRYLAPERFRDQTDARADVYSLGLTLYELATMQPAFEDANQARLIERVLTENPPRPRLVNLAISRDLETILLKAVEKDPQTRYQSAGELAEDLRRYLDERPILARRPSVWQRTIKFARRHRPAVVTAGVALVVAVLLTAVVTGYFLGDRAAQHANAVAKARTALGNALALSQQKKWFEAKRAAQHVEELLPAGVGQPIRVKARMLQEDVRAVRKLHEARMLLLSGSTGEWSMPAEVEKAFGDTFREIGLPIVTLAAEEAGQKIKARLLPLEMALLLDDWAVLRRSRNRADPVWKHLFAVAARIDQNPERSRLRNIILDDDGNELLRLIKSPEIRSWPASSYRLLGASVSRSGLTNRAIELLRIGQHVHPGDFWIHLHLAASLNDAKRHADAVAAFRIALALRSREPFVMAFMAGSLYELGHYSEAKTLLEKALKLREHFPEARNHYGMVLQKLGDPQDAVRHIRAAIARKPNIAAFHYSLGVVLLEQKKTAASIDAFENALRFNPKSVGANAGLGSARLQQKDFAGAARAYRRALGLAPKDPNLWYNLGKVLQNNKDLKSAIEAYQSALKYDKSIAMAYVNIGAALNDLKKHKKAIEVLTEAIKIDGRLSLAHYNLGNAYRERGDLPNAIAAFKQAIVCDSKNANAWNNLGNIYQRQKDLVKAEAAYQKAFAADAKHVKALSNFAALLMQKGKWREAEVHLQKAVATDENYGIAHANLGLIRYMRHDYKHAINSYRRALKLNPNLIQSYLGLGLSLRGVGRFLEARDQFQQAQLKSPGSSAIDGLLNQAKQLTELESRLAGVLSGKSLLNDADKVKFAHVCTYTQRYAAAAGLYRDAFKGSPKSAANIKTGVRYNAACAAVLASAGKGKEAKSLDASARATWRRQALTWLRADLAAWNKLAANAKLRALIRGKLVMWRIDTRLTSVRDQKQLQQLPKSERDQWLTFWAEVAKQAR